MKEKLRKKQPVAYRILENALLGKTSAHAYLFFGDKGCGKFKSAILLAQSLLCEKEGFACEKCDVCRRVAENNFSDLIIIDGSIKTIKKGNKLELKKIIVALSGPLTNLICIIIFYNINIGIFYNLIIIYSNKLYLCR